MIENFSTGFYNKLIGGTNLKTKLGASDSDRKIYNTLAPQSAALPYITFGVLTDTPEGIFGNLSKIESMTFWLNVFSSTSPVNCLQIADLVAALMDDCTFDITNYSFMVCKREYTGNLAYDLTNGVYQIPMRYRVMACKS